MHLQVGDYVLSPDIVVERKALTDLFASLGSGRLYNQVLHPTTHTVLPVLTVVLLANLPAGPVASFACVVIPLARPLSISTCEDVSARRLVLTSINSRSIRCSGYTPLNPH